MVMKLIVYLASNGEINGEINSGLNNKEKLNKIHKELLKKRGSFFHFQRN